MNFKCPGCDEFFNDKEFVPLNLPCGHTFCKRCIFKYQENNSIQVECSICQNQFKNPFHGGNINKLSKNYIAIQLGCEARLKLQRFQKCQIHDQEPMKFFCEKCQTLFCPSCIDEHAGHKFILQKYSCEILKKKIQNLKNKLKERVKFLGDNYKKTSEDIKDIEVQTKIEKESFNQQVSDYKEILNQKQNDWKEHFQVKYAREQLKLDEQKHDLNLVYDELQEQKKMVNELNNLLLKNENPKKIKIMFEKLNNSFENFSSKKHFKKYEFQMYNLDINDKFINNHIGYISLVKKEPVFVMMGDISKVLIYKMYSNQWQKVELPLSTYYINQDCKSVFISKNEIFLTGGANEASVFILNLENQKICAKTPMNIERDNHGIINFQNNVYVFGGYNKNLKQCLNQCEKYDISTDKWKKIRSMNFKRKEFGIIQSGMFFKKEIFYFWRQ